MFENDPRNVFENDPPASAKDSLIVSAEIREGFTGEDAMLPTIFALVTVRARLIQGRTSKFGSRAHSEVPSTYQLTQQPSFTGKRGLGRPTEL